MESRDSKLIADGRAWRVDGRAQALVGPGLATPLLLNPLQHGFRPNHSCQTQLIDFIDEVQQSMNARQQTDLVFIDFFKAFDTVYLTGD